MGQAETILATANQSVLEELKYLIDDIERDVEDYPDGYGVVEAFEDFSDRIEQNKSEVSVPVIRNVREIYIALGMAKVVTEEQLSRTIVSDGKRYWFKLNGVKYRFSSSH